MTITCCGPTILYVSLFIYSFLISFLFNIAGFKHKLPRNNESTEVFVNFYVYDIYDISENTMDYSLKCYFRQSWNDPRLKVVQCVPSTIVSHNL